MSSTPLLSSPPSAGFPAADLIETSASPLPDLLEKTDLKEKSTPNVVRTRCVTTDPFPSLELVGPPPFEDIYGEPLYVARAIVDDGIHPCKAGPHLQAYCRVPFGGEERCYDATFDIVQVTEEMEWVTTSHGIIPEGRKPVEGGHEGGGEPLYHALVTMCDEFKVPGKTGVHLKGANIAWGYNEVIERENYSILCWRN